MKAAERTQIRVNVALNQIDQTDSPLKLRFAVAYAIGYIDALTDERLISLDGAALYRQDALERRRVRLAVFGVTLDPDEP
jgi:hypothetical protein